MPKPLLSLIILGEGPIASALEVILKAPVVRRNQDDSGWDWPKGGVADRCKAILVASSYSGADRIVRYQSEVWAALNASRIGVVVVVAEPSVGSTLLERDVFGRKNTSGSRFSDFADVLRVIEGQLSLSHVVDAVGNVELLPVDAWLREARDASCIPQLLTAIKERSAPDLERLLPLALNVHWDSVCFPTHKFPNAHVHANKIVEWLRSVTPGVTHQWRTGFELIEPLANR